MATNRGPLRSIRICYVRTTQQTEEQPKISNRNGGSNNNKTTKIIRQRFDEVMQLLLAINCKLDWNRIWHGVMRVRKKNAALGNRVAAAAWTWNKRICGTAVLMIQCSLRGNIWCWLFVFGIAFCARGQIGEKCKHNGLFFCLFVWLVAAAGVGYRAYVAHHFHISIGFMKNFNRSGINFFGRAAAAKACTNAQWICRHAGPHVGYSSNFLIGYNRILKEELMLLLAAERHAMNDGRLSHFLSAELIYADIFAVVYFDSALLD